MYIRIHKIKFIVFILIIFILALSINTFIVKSNTKNTVEIEIDDVNKYKNEIKFLEDEIKKYKNNLKVKNEEIDSILKLNNEIKNFYSKLKEFTITAYDLSVQSCGKTKNNKAYGITRLGFDLNNHTWETARVIAVDPDIIPLGSLVYIQFETEYYKKYTGIYKAMDTGSHIKGNRIDLFIEDCGDTKISKEAIKFGVTKANVVIL